MPWEDEADPETNEKVGEAAVAEYCHEGIPMKYQQGKSHPSAHRILLRPLGALEMSMEKYARNLTQKYGFIVPDSVKAANIATADKGIVYQIGPDAWKDSPSGVQAEIGDVVSFVRNAGCVFEEESENGNKQVLRVVNDIDIYYNHGPYKPAMESESEDSNG